MKGLLKFITCGSVDDGKSTLIGHILYDSKLLYADQEKALELDSKVGSRNGKIDYYQVKVKSIELAADFQKLTASSDINSILQLSGIIAAFIVNKNNG